MTSHGGAASLRWQLYGCYTKGTRYHSIAYTLCDYSRTCICRQSMCMHFRSLSFFILDRCHFAYRLLFNGRRLIAISNKWCWPCMERTCTTKLIIRMLSILQHHAHVLRCCFLLTDWVCSSSQQVCNAVSASSTHSAFSLSNICLDSTAAPSKSAQRRARPSATWRHDVTHQKIYVYATVRDAALFLNISFYE